MNRSQLFALGFGFALVFFMAVYPPWYNAYEAEPGFKVGRGFLWSPPNTRRTIPTFVHVDGEQLFAEIAAIASLTGLVVVGLGIASIRREPSMPDSVA